MREPNKIPTARDLMSPSLLVFRPDQPIVEAIQALLKYGISGGPVVDRDGRLLGFLSELDCLRLLAAEEFYVEHEDEGKSVGDCMTAGGRSIPPDLGIYAISHYFLTAPIRRLPVVQDGKLIGQVSRRDVLRGMEAVNRRRLVRRRYPDYIQPADTSGARRVRL